MIPKKIVSFTLNKISIIENEEKRKLKDS